MSASHSDSRTKNTTSTETSLTTVNENVSGNQGITTFAGGDASLTYTPVTVTNSTDAGAVKEGISAAITAINANASSTKDLVAYSKDSTDRAFAIVDANANRELNFASETLSKFGTQLADIQTANQTQLGNVVSSLAKSNYENNESSNQQVINAVQTVAAESNDLLREVFKYGAIALGVAVGGFLLIKGRKYLS
jgi:hypothetical protein